MKKALLLAAVLLAAHAVPALAASAIVYGERTVAAVTAGKLEDAVRQATERCGRVDANCRLLYSCSDAGYGYVAAARSGNWIESVGGTCGQVSMEAARETAMELCARNAQTAPCEMRSTWIDRR